MVKWLVLLLLMVNCSWGTLESSYEEGTNYANSLQDQTKAALSTINKSEIPGFTTDNPPEAALYGNAKIPEGIMPMTINKFGNSSVATIPTLLDLIMKGKMETQKLLSGDNIVLASVGAGMNINALTYRMV